MNRALKLNVKNSLMVPLRELSSLDALLCPRSVAVIGASSRHGHFANQPISNLLKHGFRGPIYPVNPNHDEVDGIKCYSSVEQLPSVPDLTVIAVPPLAAVEALEVCAELGVGAAILIASGFAESGIAERIGLQSRVAEICRSSDIRVCGPNTLGVANWADGIVPFASGNIPPTPKIGSIAVVSQSGGLGFTIVNRAWSLDAGIGHLSVAGNEADVSIPQFAQWYLHRPDVNTVLCYMESLRDIAGLKELGECSIEMGKPVFVLKAGRSEQAQRAALAHTGALATSDEVCSAAFKKWGLVRVGSLDGLINAGALAARSRAPQPGGVGLYCQGGGIAVLTSDLLESNGIDLPEISAETSSSIAELLPDSSAANPLDSGGQFLSKGPEPLADALRIFESDSAIDTVVVMAMPVLGDRAETYTTALESASKMSRKPIVVIPYSAGRLTEGNINRLKDAGLLVLEPPGGAMEGLRSWLQSGGVLAGRFDDTVNDPGSDRATRARSIIEEWRDEGLNVIPEYEAVRLLGVYEIASLPQRLAVDEMQAKVIAQQIGPLVAMKIASPDLAHRSDVGGVVLNVEAERAGEVFTEIVERVSQAVPEARILGASVIEMAPPGREFILGSSRDETFGPVVLAGLGGVFAEVINDVSLRLPPVDFANASAMLNELRGSAVFSGYRGEAPVDIDALAKIAERLGTLLNDVGDLVRAIDLNPVIAYPKGTPPVVADALIELMPR